MGICHLENKFVLSSHNKYHHRIFWGGKIPDVGIGAWLHVMRASTACAISSNSTSPDELRSAVETVQLKKEKCSEVW